MSQGVYLIRDENGVVLHVGRTVSGQKGLAQRLENHRSGKSSFVKIHLKGERDLLKNNFTFQYIEVEDDRERALLENHAIAWYCPVHLGLGRKTDLTAYLATGT
jgi:excinuclease UvrABC nuclease subunit